MVTGLGMPHAIVALFHRPPRPTSATELGEAPDSCRRGVDNPGNIGSIVRNAAALGWDGLLLDHTSADPLARRALRVAMGTAFALPHARTSTLADDLRAAARRSDPVRAHTGPGPPTSATSDRPAGGRSLIGSERAGLSDELLAIARPVRIPMAAGVDSLNAAAAVAVACYALA
jgi:tRNA G18 (ribose-2'-O)-methylase SpoU